MLGNLAKKLRILGYDSKYFSSIDDSIIITIAKNEKRIIVTKDEQVTKIGEKQDIVTVLIRGNDEIEQIAQIHEKIKLDQFVIDTQFSRCTACNGNLHTIEKYRIIGKVPERVLEREERFWMCNTCKKIYWNGTHFKNLQAFVTKLNVRIK